MLPAQLPETLAGQRQQAVYAPGHRFEQQRVDPGQAEQRVAAPLHRPQHRLVAAQGGAGRFQVVAVQHRAVVPNQQYRLAFRQP